MARTTTRPLTGTEPLKTGDRVTLDLIFREGSGWEMARTGTVLVPVSGGVVGMRSRYYGGDPVRAAGTPTRQEPTIDFEPGDVVVVQFEPNGVEYTYVRGATRFLGEGTVTPPSDKSVRDLFAAGRARLIARSNRAFSEPITVHNCETRLGAGLPF